MNSVLNDFVFHWLNAGFGTAEQLLQFFASEILERHREEVRIENGKQLVFSLWSPTVLPNS